MLILALALQSTASIDRDLQRSLLNTAARQLEQRGEVARAATADRNMAIEWYYRCVRTQGAQKLPYLSACNGDYQLVRQRAVDAEVAWAGVNFDGRGVDRFLARVRQEAAAAHRIAITAMK